MSATAKIIFFDMRNIKFDSSMKLLALSLFCFLVVITRCYIWKKMHSTESTREETRINFELNFVKFSKVFENNKFGICV